MKQKTDPLEYFRLKQAKAAKVSEVSEATASSSIPVEERVNFHIGNPIQDKVLSSAYLRMILGIDIRKINLSEDDLDKIVDEIDWGIEDKTKLEFFVELIKKSAPYMPRGGFSKNNPDFLVKYFYDWLLKKQEEPLSYDLGESSGKREIILASGGKYEALRVLFHSLSRFLVSLPAQILLFNIELPGHLISYTGLEFIQLPDDEAKMTAGLQQHLAGSSGFPNFLILGKNTSENTRRNLRQLSLKHPLFFIEVNNAPNHLSLAREAKMMDRVLRILTPGIFSPRLNNLSTVFLAGNADYIRVIETLQFQLKGTPSASEVEFLSYILREKYAGVEEPDKRIEITVEPAYESFPFPLLRNNRLRPYAGELESRLDGIITGKTKFIDSIFDRLNRGETELAHRSEKFPAFFSYDRFSGYDSRRLLDEFTSNVDSGEWKKELVNSFLHSFLKHHPEYKIGSSLVVSGSSRTGLGLLGFHCGIKEVIIPDLSWTYEHCFPAVNVVPLRDDYELDVDAIINLVKNKLSNDPHWKSYGAIALNNPHNATGQVFDSGELRRLIKWLLERNIFIIDDLSYQNVAPVDQLTDIKTARQLADELNSQGYITEEHANHLITIHSLSKIDSFAGARLSVIEIRDEEMFGRFEKIMASIKPNLAAVFLAYLFYRNSSETVNAYWRHRNRIFKERMDSISAAVTILPKIRNRFDISIRPPKGSMYPQMIIEKLPPGLSLDWLASGLARQGIGLVPLSTFARTEKGFERGRKTFRLTLGGSDNAEILLKKTRRVLIDLNRMIAEEEANYNRKKFAVTPLPVKKILPQTDQIQKWDFIENELIRECRLHLQKNFSRLDEGLQNRDYEKIFGLDYLRERLFLFRQRYTDRLNITADLMEISLGSKGKYLTDTLEYEFFKDNLADREQRFKSRSYDRTVHPTQMYSIKSDLLFEEIIECAVKRKNVPLILIKKAAGELLKEFLGLNVAIISSEESTELILDLNTIIAAENFSILHSGFPFQTFHSFWGDWDGSNRPSGQGHSLVAAVLIENVARQSRLLQILLKYDRHVKIDSNLLSEIEKLRDTNNRFSKLLTQITMLTHQLEKRYRGILPFNVKPGRVRELGMKLRIARDPLTSLWHHNDRLERKMLELRTKRRETLEYYFSLNKQLRKVLRANIPSIVKNINNHELLIEACTFKDLLKRFVITPRIHQKLITAQDQFAIDTTVHNINEINEISGKYGNPGMVMALQVSMSAKAEALISLDRKTRAVREQSLRENHELEIPYISLIPLFEDIEAVRNLKGYLNKIWEYSLLSRRINQETNERFLELIGEVFVAGSDLSQQVGQAAGMNLFKEAKYELTSWLAEKGLIGKVRMKMGSGEPMQRQGGYYTPVVGMPAFIHSPDTQKRFSAYLKESTKKSTEYATTPLIGVFAGGDLRTFQSNISEKLRYLPLLELTQLLYHVRESQKFYETAIIRAGEPLVETRLQFRSRGLKELERLTIGTKDKLYDDFLNILTENFRQILYGREEDVVGIHIISYFIARTTPPLRDRPTIRPGQGPAGDAGQKILEKIAGTIPFSRYGSLLRAIAHNQSQTAVLGINQLTTGLFRALDSFSQKQFAEGEAAVLIEDRILPNLPVYEILHSLRLYHDVSLIYLNRLETAFPAGNSAFLALREDIDSLSKYLILFQRELIRRHGLNVTDFFESDKFIADLLPTLRPDLAVLLQPDLFNTDPDLLLSSISGNVDAKWLGEMRKLLLIPERIGYWRAKIWNMLEIPVKQRVSSFVELAVALHSLSSNTRTMDLPFAPRKLKVSHNLSDFFKMSNDDNMHQFLAAAFEYLSVVSEGMVEVPINIIRAIKEVERIIKIEEQALAEREQDLLRFYLLQIARLAGENG